jgi:hypothetical protein
MSEWPKKPIWWVENQKAHVSIPFTWFLPEVKRVLEKGFPNLKGIVAGGPAVYLMPEYLSGISNIEIGYSAPGLLQRVNPLATRTTLGCPRKCGFCGVKIIEPECKELDDWPDLPILADNNLLAASQPHFDKVMDRLERHNWADFTQGLDTRLLNEHHAERIARISKDKRTRVRLALDHMGYSDDWENAWEKLRNAGVPKRRVYSYAIIGFNDGIEEAWRRCEWIEKHGAVALPMWFHPLNSLHHNIVTDEQKKLGWSDKERVRIMRWYYKHSGSKPEMVAAA